MADYRVIYKNGQFKIFHTIQEAYDVSMKDPSICKISFNDSNGKKYHWNKKFKGIVIDRFDETILSIKNKSYQQTESNDINNIFWINQSIYLEVEYLGLEPTISYPKIMEVLTDKEFRQKFKINGIDLKVLCQV